MLNRTRVATHLRFSKCQPLPSHGTLWTGKANLAVGAVPTQVSTVNLPKKWRKKAEARCAERGARLTPARLAAFAALVSSDKPLSAYELVAELEQRENKKIAPLTVYRHLDFLMDVGLVHRVESIQSYLPCVHAEHTHDNQYLLCSTCGQVDELGSSELAQALQKIAAQHKFQAEHAMVEVKGQCATCAAAAG
ncbi:MAG: Fur family transcriptional regulator [Gammaproteobacteria bacterium]